MQKILQFFIFFMTIFSYITCDDSDYCYAEDETPYEHFLDWTSYDYVKGSTYKRDCRLIYVWGLVKHGVRNLTDEQIQRNKNLFQLKKDIKENYQENRSALCSEDFYHIRSWKDTDSLDSQQNDDLAEEAYSNHEQFARYLKRYISSKTEKLTKDDFDFQTSKVAGASDSALRFTNVILGSNTYKPVVNGITENNLMLKAKSDCAKWTGDDTEMNAFINSSDFQALRDRVSSRLGFTYRLSHENIIAMYESCIIGKVTSNPPFCAAFLPDDLKVLEYKGDLKHYYEYGYGNPLSEKMGCPLVADMVDKLSKASSETLDGKRGAFYFADEENIMGMLTKLGLYRDDQPLRHDNYQYQKYNRKWISSLSSPYTATIHAFLFDCANDEKKVEFYHNQNIIKLESCKTTSGSKCTLDGFLSDVKKTLKEDKCDEDFCAVSGSKSKKQN